MLRCRSVASREFVFVARVRVRSGILDHVCTDTITRMPPRLWIFLSSLQEAFFSTLLAILGVDLAVAKPRPARSPAAKT
jgi:hypothetical protein